MKIVSQTLESIANVEWYPVIGLLIFSIFFVALIIRVGRMSRQQIDEYSHLPLDEKELTKEEPFKQSKTE